MEPNEQKLTKKEKRELRRQERSQTEDLAHIKQRRKRIRSWIIGMVSLVLVGGLGWLIATAPKGPNLPPTVMQGHIESNPKAHISDASIPDAVQRHMLEHADGKDKPGIIIQYNCKKYSCESDLVSKLTDLVKQYPENIYLAPNNYDGKIILTKLGQSKILESFDEQVIKEFIGQ